MLVFFRDLVRDSIVRGMEEWSANGDELPRVWIEQLQELGGKCGPQIAEGNHEVRQLGDPEGKQTSGSGVHAVEHWARVAIAADGEDLSFSDVDMLGERNHAEDRVDVDDGDAVLAVDNEADYIDALHDGGELREPLTKRIGAAIRVRWKDADCIRMQRKGGGVIAPHRVDVRFNYLDHLLAHRVDTVSARAVLQGWDGLRAKFGADHPCID